MARCKTCDREIVWVKPETGSDLPLDARPVDAYLYFDDGMKAAPALHVAIGGSSETAPLKTLGPLYVSHFLTCPQAAQHSKQGAR